MRAEQNALEGRTLVLERPAELDRLRAPWAKLVRPGVARAFRRFPDSLIEIAARLRPPALGRAVAAHAEACELEINRPGPRGGGVPEVYLRVGTRPLLLSLSVGRVPAFYPQLLREILQSVGVVRSQYACALGLVRPVERRTLADCAKQYDALYPGLLADLPMPKDPARFFSVFEDSGACLFADPSGKTWRFSLSGGDHGPGPSLRVWLNHFSQHFFRA